MSTEFESDQLVSVQLSRGNWATVLQGLSDRADLMEKLGWLQHAREVRALVRKLAKFVDEAPSEEVRENVSP